jgi:hypothetical protein
MLLPDQWVGSDRIECGEIFGRERAKRQQLTTQVRLEVDGHRGSAAPQGRMPDLNLDFAGGICNHVTSRHAP